MLFENVIKNNTTWLAWFVYTPRNEYWIFKSILIYKQNRQSNFKIIKVLMLNKISISYIVTFPNDKMKMLGLSTSCKQLQHF